MYTVYKITNNVSGKCYIGLTTNLKQRWNQHKTQRNKGKLGLYKDMREYGIENFEISVQFMTDNKDLARWMERIYILSERERGYVYNIMDGCEADYSIIEDETYLTFYMNYKEYWQYFHRLCNALEIYCGLLFVPESDPSDFIEYINGRSFTNDYYNTNDEFKVPYDFKFLYAIGCVSIVNHRIKLTSKAHRILKVVTKYEKIKDKEREKRRKQEILDLRRWI